MYKEFTFQGSKINTSCTYFFKVLTLGMIFFSTAFGQMPVITSFTPGTGSVGSITTVTGSNFSNAITCKIGGVNAIVVSNSATQLVAMVMPGAATGNIQITTGGGTGSSAGNYIVEPSKPPFTQQGSKLIGSGSVGSSVYQGWSSAMSADGNTAIVGAPFDDAGGGAAWIYTRTGNTWSQQGVKLVGNDSSGIPYQGWSVALSADGNTALVGGPYDSNEIGAAWVFTRSGNTWSQQGNKLVGTGNVVGSVYQGFSVALSADGNTALLGGPYDNSFTGALWIFKRTGTTWAQQGAKLTASDIVGFASLGSSVSLSADGLTAVAGGFYDNSNIGATWVFISNGTTWSQQGAKLVGTGTTGSTVFQGYSVAVSANGNTAIVGGLNDNNGAGAAWVFTRSGSTWSQQGSKIIASGGVGSAINLGNSVALSADGNTALISANYDDGNEGAVWVFKRAGSSWTQNGNKLKGSGNVGAAQQGFSVGISSSGNDALIGGYADQSFKGASWVFVPALTNANLTNLAISSGTLTPSFSFPVLAYTANVGNAISSINVTPTTDSASFSTIVVRVNGGVFTPVLSGTASSALALNVGSNTIDVLVTAQDGTTTKTYTVTVTRACPGINATISGTNAICAGTTTNLNVNITGGIAPFSVVYSGGSLSNYNSGANITVSPGSNTVYTLTSVTDANNCAATLTGSANITIKAVVGIATATAANSSVCPLGTTTLTANGVVGENALVTWWSASGGSGTNYGTGTSLPLAGAGTYYARVTGDCGPPDEASVTINQNPIPVVSNQPVSACSGSAFSVNPSGVPIGTTYAWGIPTYSGAVSGGSAQTTQPTISQTLTISGAASGSATYTVTPSAGTCSGADFTVTVTVNPAAIVTNKSETICSGQTFSVSPSGVPSSTTYSWGSPVYSGTVSGGSAQSGQATIGQSLSISGNSSGTASYTVTPLTGSCPGANFSVIVTVNPLPSSGNLTSAACSGQVFNVVPSGMPLNTTYSWGIPSYTGAVSGGSSQSVQGSISQTLTNGSTAAGTAIYNVTPTAGSCAGTAFFVTITVNPTPVVSNETVEICSGQAFNVTPSGVLSGTTYSWGVPAYVGSITGGSAQTGQSSISQALSNSGIGSGTATYTVIPLTGTCSGAGFSLTATINPTPVVSNKTDTICGGQPFSVNPSGIPVGTVYSWATPTYTGSVSGGSAQPGQSNISQILMNSGTVSGTATYTVTPLSGTCPGNNFTVTIAVNPIPSSGNLAGAACSGQPFSVNPSGVPLGTTYSWGVPVYAGSITGGSMQSGQASISQTLANSSAVSGTATYTITPLAGTCAGSTFATTISIYPKPVPTFTTAPGANSCAANSIVYATQTGMSNYAWSLPGTAGTDYTILSGSVASSSNTVTLKWLTAGNKSVSVNYLDANNCSGASAANAITLVDLGVTPSVSIAITTGSNPACLNSSVTFTATPTNGGPSPSYQWFRNGVSVATVVGPVYTVNNIVGITNVYVVMTPSSGLCTTAPNAISATTVIALAGNTWTGTQSAVWGDSRNWCLGTIPTSTTNVFIPATSRNPVIFTNTAVNDVILASNAAILLNNSTLTINGSVSGTGVFDGAGNSGVTFTSSGNIGTLYFSPTGLSSVIFTGNGATATLGNATNIAQQLNVGSATLVTNDFLTIKSNASGTAAVGPITSGNITGNVVVERYIPKNAFRSWRLLAVPVTGSGTFRSEWQENQAPMVNGVPGYGTLLTSSTGGNGYDAQTAGNSLLFWNGTGWTAVGSTLNQMNTNKGYFLYVRGDRSANIQPGNVNPGFTTLRTRGNLYQGSQPAIPVPPVTNVLVGNVYACALDFSTIIKSGITAFKVWDPKLLGTLGFGGYQTFSGINNYDPIPGGGSYGSLANSRIESGQAFFVSSVAGGSIQLTETSKATGSRNVFRENGQIAQIKTMLYTSQESASVLADGNTVVFDETYDNKMDDADVLKMSNPGENLSIFNNNNHWVIEGRKRILENDSIHYAISNLQQKRYALEVAPKNIKPGIEAWMYDRYDNKNYAVDLSKSTFINFDVTSDSRSSGADRFVLVLKKQPKASEIIEDKKAVSFTFAPNPVINGQVNITINSKLEGSYALRLLNVLGQVLFIQQLKHTGGVGSFSVKLPAKYSGLHRIELICPDKTNVVQNLLMVNGH